jgi:hypothetical protein
MSPNGNESAIDRALADLAERVAATVARAPGPAERRLVLLQAFAAARRLTNGIPPDTNRAELDQLLHDQAALSSRLLAAWTSAR